MIALYILGAFLALLLITAGIIGTGWQYERSIRIKAPAERVWPHVSSLEATDTWSPWSGKDPSMLREFSGDPGKPGSHYRWDSSQKEVGAGSQTITGILENQQMDSRIEFIRPFKGTAEAFIRIKAYDKDITDVTWGIRSRTPYPMNIIKLFGLIRKNMNRDFDIGLQKLKIRCEETASD